MVNTTRVKKNKYEERGKCAINYASKKIFQKAEDSHIRKNSK